MNIQVSPSHPSNKGDTISGWARFAHRFTQYYRTADLWSPLELGLESGCSFHSVVEHQLGTRHFQT